MKNNLFIRSTKKLINLLFKKENNPIIYIVLITFCISCNKDHQDNLNVFQYELIGKEKENIDITKILNKRLTEFGFSEDDYEIYTSNDIINLKVKNVSNENDLKLLVLSSGQIKISDIVDGQKSINFLRSFFNSYKENLNIDSSLFKNADEELFDIDDDEKKSKAVLDEELLFEKISAYQNGDNIILNCKILDTAFLNKIIFASQFNKLLEKEKLKWKYNKITKNSQYIEFLMLDKTQFPLVTYMENINLNYDPDGTPGISISLNSEGKELFEKYTEQRINKRIALILDDMILSTPIIISEISDGRISIIGNKDLNYIKTIISVAKGGLYPIKLKLVNKTQLGTSAK